MAAASLPRQPLHEGRHPKTNNNMGETMKDHFDIHQHITNQIITAIEAGAGEFRLPWHRTAGSIMRPVNVASKKPYQGVNIPTLWAASDAAGYEAGTWGTYKQWTEAGAQVKNGEKASYIVFYKEISVAADEGSDDDNGTRLFARATPVFAAEQVEGYAAPALPETPAAIVEPIEAAEAFVAATGAVIHHGGNRAFYRRTTDDIHLPPREAFLGTATSNAAEAYASTKLHELTHWAGAEKRCNRQFGKRFGDEAYAMEELVAELGAAFLCADLGITDTPRTDHAQYLDNWLRVLKADKKAIFTAASKASQAVAYLASLQPA
jgi:antirestriction protein ArdC